jgi:UDP-N-acetylmuramoyl-tripeptide--D-alanyl-D-alanine ligase
MLTFSEKEILEITCGVRIGVETPSELKERLISSVSTDTRTLEPGALFVALVGERYNGHSFCETAFRKGAALILVSDEKMLPSDAPGICVKDTLTALQAIARAYRRKLACKVIAVTGSVGKTSTREMLYAALSSSLRTHATKHNLNNEIGLPLTILSAPSDTELLIVEMGMRMRGEIRTLSRIAEPNIAVITNAGLSHIERLGSREEILLAKMEICDGLTGDKILLINGDDNKLVEHVGHANSTNWNTVGITKIAQDDDAKILPSSASSISIDLCVAARDVHADPSGMRFSVDIMKGIRSDTDDLGMFTLPCIGLHHVRNALFSILSAAYLGIPVEAVRKGLVTFLPAGSRGRMIRTQKYLVYDDAYNAGPESMAAAFESVRILGGTNRKVAVLGGMLELGVHAAKEHFNIGIEAARSGMDIILVCGEYRNYVMDGAHSVNPDIPVYLYDSRDELTDALLLTIREGDVILVKASHSFEMEKVARAIVDSDGPIEEVHTEDRL